MIRKSHLVPLLGGILFGMFVGQSVAFAESAGQVLLARDSIWRFLDNGTDQGNAWKAPGFNDAAWRRGRAPLGFGDDFSETDATLPLATSVDFGSPDNKHMTTYFRTTADIKGLSDLKDMEVYIHVDDGAVVYVNGYEAFRKGISDGSVSFTTGAKFKPKEETFTIPASLLREGLNVFAVEVHQDDPSSSDLWFELGIRGVGMKSEAKADTKAAVAPKAAVSKVTVTFNGDTTTAKGLTWYTPLSVPGNDLEVAEGSAVAPDFGKGLRFTGRSHVSTNSPAEYVHKAEATGLKANTLYRYRVGDAAAGIWSTVGTFKTAPVSGPFTFIDLADTQAKSEDESLLSASTLAKAMATVPGADLMVHNGDLVDTGMNEPQWNSLLGNAQATLMNITMAPVAGNHEEDKASFYDHFNVKPAPDSSTETGAYYSFDYSNAHFTMLNTNEDSKEYANLSPGQVKWLIDDVKAAKAKGADWVIAVVHKGPYTTSNHATDADIAGTNGVRTLIAPLMSQAGVDLVLQGHDHIYARSKPIADGKAVPVEKLTEAVGGSSVEYSVKPNGTVYVIPNTAGAKVYYKNKKLGQEYYGLFEVADEHHAAVYGADPSDASRPVRSQVQNFVAFSVDGTRLTAVSYEVDKSKNNGQAYVIDRFGILK